MPNDLTLELTRPKQNLQILHRYQHVPPAWFIPHCSRLTASLPQKTTSTNGRYAHRHCLLLLPTTSLTKMSSGEAFPTLPVSSHYGTMADHTPGIVTTEWYAPSSVCLLLPSCDRYINDLANCPVDSTVANASQYSYAEPYSTPYPSSTLDSQQWTQYARASIHEFPTSNYPLNPPPHLQFQQLPHQVKDPSRPRSSPSTFGPAVDNVSWPTTNGLGIFSSVGQPTPPITSTFPPSVFQTYPQEDQYTGASPPEIRQPQPRRPFPNIAPNPAQVAAQKRKRDEDDQQETTTASGKKRKRTSSVASADLSEDDRFLVQLKEKESLPWKDIANRFQSDLGKNFQVAALQMRYKRLREKFREWQDEDIHALRLAHEYWEKNKWDIIAQKMLDNGINERWPSRHCARKWQELETQAATLAATASMTPALSQFSSPIDAPTQFTFMPIQ